MTRVRSGDPRFGPVCQCGGTKAKQAKTCQPCHSQIRGYGVHTKAEIDRKARLRYMGQKPAVGCEDEALIAHATELDRARTSVDGEVAALVEEQMRDERLGHLSRDRWMVSLDSLDQFGRPLYESVAA